jgi:hypothetical protein
LHRHVHEVLPFEYDYGQKPEDLYLVVLAQRRHIAQIAKNPAGARRG